MENKNDKDDDIETIGSISSSDGLDIHDKPLMKLIQRLLGDCKQNTVLTNSQLIDIMEVELSINIQQMNDLEKDIYMTVIKKFLKDWPRWDQFDKIIFRSKQVRSSQDLQKVWLNEYQTLKEYLKKMINLSKPLAEAAIRELITKHSELKASENGVDSDDDNIVMDINCTRNQLNQLIYRYPQVTYNNQNIFNTKNEPANKIISTSTYPMKVVLNWPNVSINVNIGGWNYTRQITDNFEHTLLNKKLPENTIRPVTKLNTNLQMSATKSAKTVNKMKKEKFYDIFMKLWESNELGQEEKNFIDMVARTVEFDLRLLPEKVKIPSKYRMNLSSYHYVRTLAYDPNSNTPSAITEAYDLGIEERNCPQLNISITRYDTDVTAVSDDWLKIQCLPCKLMFDAKQHNELLMHFNLKHNSKEPDWKCTKCNESFPNTKLAEDHWFHRPCA